MNSLQYITSRILYIVQRASYEFTEFINGILLFLLGLFVFNPFWETLLSSPTYQTLALLPIAEDLQGFLLAFLGASIIGALVYNTLYWRKTFAFIATLTWLYISVFVIAANVESAASILYPVLTLQSGWVFVRILIEDKI